MSLRGNPWIWTGIGAVLALQLLFVHAAPLNDVFGSAPLTAWEWAVTFAAALPVVPVIEAEKRWRAA
jgi:magnesium-transporting ATPase (P-type)